MYVFSKGEPERLNVVLNHDVYELLSCVGLGIEQPSDEADSDGERIAGFEPWKTILDEGEVLAQLVGLDKCYGP